MTHSQEPWISEGLPSALKGIARFEGMIGNDPCGFSGELNHIGNTLKKEDADRIVACVNACAGIPTEDLPRFANAWKRAQELGELFQIPTEEEILSGGEQFLRDIVESWRNKIRTNAQ